MSFRCLPFFALLVVLAVPRTAIGQAPLHPVANDSLITQLFAQEQKLRDRPRQVFKQKHHRRKVTVKSRVFQSPHVGRQPFLREKTRYFKNGAVYRHVVFKGGRQLPPVLEYRVLNGTVVYAFFLDDQRKPRTIVNHRPFNRTAYAQSK